MTRVCLKRRSAWASVRNILNVRLSTFPVFLPSSPAHLIRFKHTLRAPSKQNLFLAGVFFCCSILLLAANSLPAKAAICCACHPPSAPSKKICLTSNYACGGNEVITKTDNPAIKDFVCDAQPLDTNSSCVPIAEGSSSALCTEGPMEAFKYTPPNIKQQTTSEVAGPIDLNVDIPGLVLSQNFAVEDNKAIIPLIGQYVSAIYIYLLGISVIVATVMVVYGGFLYMLGSTGSGTKRGKDAIKNALIGLVLLFGSYTILKTINPDTVNLSPLRVPLVKRLEEVSSSQITQVTNKAPLASKEMLQKTISKAEETGGATFSCFVYASMIFESGGKMNVVGHDENAQDTTYKVGARQTFLRGGVKYSGNTFQALECKDSSCQKSDITNDDTFDLAAPPDYGLDWKYSHGFGAAQSTIFAKNDPCPGLTQLGRGFRVGKKCYTIQDLFDSDKQIEAMLEHYATCYKETKDGTNPAAGYICYGGRSLKPESKIVVDRVNAFNDCKSKLP